MTARILQVTEEQYFADPCEVPSLSQSIATVLAQKSPAHAYCAHPRLGKPPEDEKQTAAVDEGSIIHALLLGKGADIDVIAADNYRTKAAQELRDSAAKAGRVPVLARRYDEILVAAAALRSNLADNGVVFDGESEIAIEWTEDGEHGNVVCRGRLDHLKLDRGIIYDPKKIVSADDRTISRHAYEYGYDIQWAAYTSAVAALRPELEGRIDFRFLFLEIEPPYSVVVLPPSAPMRAMGEARWSRAVRLWEQCLRENRWPSYDSRGRELELQPWALIQEGIE